MIDFKYPNISTENGDTIYVSEEVYHTNALKINEIIFDITGETSDLYYMKYLRVANENYEIYSDCVYSDWMFADELSSLDITFDSSKQLWISYKFVQVGNGPLKINSITPTIETPSGVYSQKFADLMNKANCIANLPAVCSTECSNTYNPYDIGSAGMMYTQLVSNVANKFGLCSEYFLVRPDQRTKDVILKEYTISSVLDKGVVNIMFTDNQPSRKVQHNPLMMDFDLGLEGNIGKSNFWSAFPGEKPKIGDIVYIPLYKRIFEIGSVSEPDDYLTTPMYWDIGLKNYEPKASVRQGNYVENLRDLITDTKKELGKKIENEELDTVLPSTLNDGNLRGGTPGMTEMIDYRMIDPALKITKLDYNINWNIVSKHHYNMDTPSGNIGVVYSNYSDLKLDTQDYTFSFIYSKDNLISTDPSSFIEDETLYFKKFTSISGEDVLVYEFGIKVGYNKVSIIIGNDTYSSTLDMDIKNGRNMWAVMCVYNHYSKSFKLQLYKLDLPQIYKNNIGQSGNKKYVLPYELKVLEQKTVQLTNEVPSEMNEGMWLLSRGDYNITKIKVLNVALSEEEYLLYINRYVDTNETRILINDMCKPDILV